MEFTELQLDEKVLQGIRKAGFTTCTQVQEETFRRTLTGKDVLVQSQTGTGKTAAFLISAFQLLLTNESMKGGQALVIAPTRELADQIEKEARLLGSYLPFRVASFYGGVGYDRQEKALRDGVDIIIGTPGRLIDFNESGRLPFNDVKILVIDEADRLFDMGFLPDLKRMLRRMPDRLARMTMLFSATLGSRVSHLAWDYMNEPEEIAIAPEHVTVDEITQELYHVTKPERIRLLLGVMKRESPESVLIFTNTKHEAVEVSRRLELNGYQCQFIIGDLPQRKRLAIIESIKSGKLRILVATDVAARGLHINDLQLVVNYDLPEDSENYVHRIGRTARAGKTGKAISLACEACVYNLEGIEKLIGKKIPSLWPTPEMYVDDASAGSLITHHHNARDPVPGRGGRGSRSRPGDRQGRTYRGEGRPEHTERQGADRAGSQRTAQSDRKPDRGVAAGSRPSGGERRDGGSGKPKTTVPGKQLPKKTGPGDQQRKPFEEKSASGQPPRKRMPEPVSKPRRPAAKPSGDGKDKGSMPPRDRMEYYREKYGESFKPAPQKAVKEPEPADSAKKGILNRILGFFKGKGPR